MLKNKDKKTANELYGQELYYTCKDTDITIAGQTAPAKTVSGTYHSLANAKSLGWHPNWSSALLSSEEPT